MRLPAALLLAALLATPAAAQPSRTKWGVRTGARLPTGDLGSRYGLGFVAGFESSYMPTWFGLAWSLQYTWFWDRSDARNVDTLQLIDLDASVRTRVALSSTFPVFVWAQAGVGLVRASVPLEPDLGTSYIGPVGGAGVELAMWSPVVLAISTDYSYLGSGPSGFRVLASVAIASH